MEGTNKFSVICECSSHVKDFMHVEDDPKLDASLWEAFCLNCMRGISIAISFDKMIINEARRPR